MDSGEHKEVEEHFTDNINNLRNNINDLLNEIDDPIESLMPGADSLPNLDVAFTAYNYDSDLESIKIDSKETLKCLANLYLEKKSMKDKNINNIIKNDSNQLADLNFTISCARRALISCMNQLDMGVNDPEMYKSVALFQKEMRDTIKMTNELQRKMKDFYKELKKELSELNKGDDDNNLIEENNSADLNLIGDPRKLNDILELYKDDPTLIKQQSKKES